MRQLVMTAMLMTSMGCASPPEAPEVTFVETEPIKLESVPLFATTDLVTITFLDGTAIDGVIVSTGPIMVWHVGEAKEEMKSRVYLVLVVINGQNDVRQVPEFALTKRIQ